MSRRNNEGEWIKIVLICIIILSVIAFFKFLFWLSVITLILGVIWLILLLINQDSEILYPVLMILISLIVFFVAYQLGYKFEQTEIGGVIVEFAESILSVEKTKNEIEENTTNILIDSLWNITSIVD